MTGSGYAVTPSHLDLHYLNLPNNIEPAAEDSLFKPENDVEWFQFTHSIFPGAATSHYHVSPSHKTTKPSPTKPSSLPVINNSMVADDKRSLHADVLPDQAVDQLTASILRHVRYKLRHRLGLEDYPQLVLRSVCRQYPLETLPFHELIFELGEERPQKHEHLKLSELTPRARVPAKTKHCRDRLLFR